MPAWLFSDWVLWVLTALFGIVGFTLAVRGLIGDRARGRPTCWKCRYDLSHSPTAAAATVTCPECGHTHTKRKQLFKTRRYWFRFAFGAMLFMIALYCHTGPEVQRRRSALGEKWWESVTPTAVWIVMLAKLKPDHFELLEERLEDRRERNHTRTTIILQEEAEEPSIDVQPDGLHMLFDWEAALLVESCKGMLDSPTTNPNDRSRLVHWCADAVNRADGAVPVLLGLLDDSDEDIRSIAIDGLCRARKERADIVELLIARVNQPLQSFVLRHETIGALGRLKQHAAAAVPALAKVMLQNGGEAEAAREALLSIGAPAAHVFVDILKNPEHPYLREAIISLPRLGRHAAAAWPNLLDYIQRTDTAFLALDTVPEIGGPIVPYLCEVAVDPASPRRVAACKGLAAMSRLELRKAQAMAVVPRLIPVALYDKDKEVVAAAIDAIEALGVSKEIAQKLAREDWINLLKALRSESRVLSTFAYGVLAAFDQDAIPWIEIAMKESLIEVNQGLVRLVMQVKAKHVSPMLVERMMRDPETYRSEIVDMLVHLGELHPEVFRQIVAALDHEDPRRREIAVNVLAATPMDAAVLLPLLGKRMELADGEKRLAAIYLLGRMGTPAAPALPALRKLAAGNDDEIKAAAEVAIISIEGIKAGE